MDTEEKLLSMLREALPMITQAFFGQAVITDAEGRCLESIDFLGAKIKPESRILEIAKLAGSSGKPQSGLSEEFEDVKICSIPVGSYVLTVLNTEAYRKNKELTDSLRKVLPDIGQIVGGEAVLFDKNGRRTYSVNHLGMIDETFIGRISQKAKMAMDTGKPFVGDSFSVEGAKAIRIPITPWLGIGLNNEQSTRYKQKLLSEVRKFKSAKYHFNDIIGGSSCMRSAIQTVTRVAQGNSTVMLIGETGTGKELFAQSIHNESNRRNMPFIAINCGAIPESLMESQLFGYVEGSFTGAKKGGVAGAFEQANGGTVFLDELSEMSLELQKKLLRVIQERVVTRLGSQKDISLDIRIIASTNRDLRMLIRENKFREDLYFRFSVMEFVLPPLRERKEDIAELIQHFIKRFNMIMGKHIIKADDEFHRLCRQYDWPGNVRELQNSVEYAMNLVYPNEQYLRWELLPLKLKNPQNMPLSGDSEIIQPWVFQETAAKNRIANSLNGLETGERITILNTLKDCQGDKKECARLLNISEVTLWRRMKKLNIKPEKLWR